MKKEMLRDEADWKICRDNLHTAWLMSNSWTPEEQAKLDAAIRREFFGEDKTKTRR